ncbi:MAG: hypothetical protein ACTSYZ_04020 [Candidatus Helarchaeota archaeon]
MLHSVIIIKKDSGICLFSEKELDFDSTLFSGFLTAVQNFAENLKIGRLTSFVTNDKVVVISSSEQVIASLIVDLEDNIDDWFSKAYIICEEFEKKYNLEEWSGEIGNFEEFSEILKEIFKSEKKNFLVEVAKWAKKEFGGELQINALLSPEKGASKLKVDILLDRGELDISTIYDKLSVFRFQGLKKDIIFIKVIDGIVGRGEIKDFIESVEQFGQMEIDEKDEEIFPYFPKMIVIVGREFSDTVFDLTDKLYRVKNKKHFIQSKNLNLKLLGPIGKLEIFNAWVEYWKWKEPYPERIFK